MNWVGGARSRIKMKNEQKKQREFFKKRRLEKAAKPRNSECIITPTLSRDLLTFNLLQIKSRKLCKEAKPMKVIKQDLDKFHAVKTLHVDIPETPLDSIKCLSERNRRVENGETFKRYRAEPEEIVHNEVLDNKKYRNSRNRSKVSESLNMLQKLSETELNYRNTNNKHEPCQYAYHGKQNSTDFDDQRSLFNENQDETESNNFPFEYGYKKISDKEYIEINNSSKESYFENDRLRKKSISVFSSYPEKGKTFKKSTTEFNGFPKETINMYSDQEFEFHPNFRKPNNKHTSSLNASHGDQNATDFDDQRIHCNELLEETESNNFPFEYGFKSMSDNEYIESNSSSKGSYTKNNRFRKKCLSVFSSYPKYDKILKKSTTDFNEFPKKTINMYSDQESAFHPSSNFSGNSVESNKHFNSNFYIKQSFLINEKGTSESYNIHKRSDIGKISDGDFERYVIKDNSYANVVNAVNFPNDSESSSPSPTNSSNAYQLAGISGNLGINNIADDIDTIRNINEKRSILKFSKNVFCNNSNKKKCTSVFDSTFLDTYKEENDINIIFSTPNKNLMEKDTNEDLDDYSLFQENGYLVRKYEHRLKHNHFSKRSSSSFESHMKRVGNMQFENDKPNFLSLNIHKHDYSLHKYMQERKWNSDSLTYKDPEFNKIPNVPSSKIQNIKSEKDMGTEPLELSFANCTTNEELAKQIVSNKSKTNLTKSYVSQGFNDCFKNAGLDTDEEKLRNSYRQKPVLGDEQETFSNSFLKDLTYNKSRAIAPVEQKNESPEKIGFSFSRPISYSIDQSVSKTPEILPANGVNSNSRSDSEAVSKTDSISSNTFVDSAIISHSDIINYEKSHEQNKSISDNNDPMELSKINVKGGILHKNNSDIEHIETNDNKKNINNETYSPASELTQEYIHAAKTVPRKEGKDKKDIHLNVENVHKKTDVIKFSENILGKRDNDKVSTTFSQDESALKRLAWTIQFEDVNNVNKSTPNRILDSKELQETEMEIKATELDSEMNVEPEIYKLICDENSHYKTEVTSENITNESSLFDSASNIPDDSHLFINEYPTNSFETVHCNTVRNSDGILSVKSTLLDLSENVLKEKLDKNISVEISEDNLTSSKAMKRNLRALNAVDIGTQTYKDKSVNSETQTYVKYSDFFCQVAFQNCSSY